MEPWQLVGPKIPNRVWTNHLLIADGFDQHIRWRRFRPQDVGCLKTGSEGAATLLALHGTGLRTRPGLAAFSRNDFLALQARYGPRILAFEHRAVRHTLAHNCRALSKALGALGQDLSLHILGLSRGGLLGRMLVEGWQDSPRGLRIEKLIFLGTPNEGAASARRDPKLREELRVWRQDIRRLLRTAQHTEPFSRLGNPYALAGHVRGGAKLSAWPGLRGTGDQLPGSQWLERLNGYAGKSPGSQAHANCLYYAVASVFEFEHGAPNPRVSEKKTWQEITREVFSSVPNDLVVPTAGVFQPQQGPDASGRFPIPKERLLVLAPECNATHTGMLRIHSVRQQVLDWLSA